MAVKIIAEAGVNHNGEKDLAFELVKVAANSGADAVKFQTFNAGRLAAMTAPKARYQQATTDAAETQLAMLQKLELPEAWHSELQAYASDLGITFISTAFDVKSLAFLQTLDLPFYKIPSGEVTNAPLLLAFAQTGKELILSTGMATLGEVEQALAILAYGYSHSGEPQSLDDVWRFWSSVAARDSIAGRVSLLHCTSQYPTPMDEVNLRAMDTLRQAFALPVGYSDHSEGLLIPIAAVARGATIIEKHFTLDRTLPGPDHKASLEPTELVDMVARIRDIELALGDGQKRPQVSEWDTRQAARQQIMVAEPIAKDEVISRTALTTARCGRGLSPVQVWDLVGKRATQDYKVGDVPE
jgi:N-acetylneuraminate synthase